MVKRNLTQATSKAHLLPHPLSKVEARIVRFLAYTGLRWGELAALRVQDVDLVKNRIKVEKNAVLINGVYELGTPKTGKTRTLGAATFLAFLIRPLVDGKPRDGFAFGNGIYPPAISQRR